MRARTFTIGGGAGYPFRVDSAGGITALPREDGSTPVIGGQLDLKTSVAAPEDWSAVEEATGNNETISDGIELYAGAGFGDPLIDGQVEDVLWALRAVADRPEGRLLEVGSGPGFLLDALHSRLPGWHLTGVDPSPDSVSEARAKGLDCHLGFLGDVSFEHQFDAVVIMGNFQLHPDLSETLERVAALSTEGAALYLDSKNPLSSARRLARTLVQTPGVGRSRPVNAFAAHAFHGLRNAPTSTQLEALCTAAGWHVEEVRTVAPRLLRFDNTHELASGLAGRVWKALDRVDGVTDNRSWIQVAATRSRPGRERQAARPGADA